MNYPGTSNLMYVIASVMLAGALMCAIAAAIHDLPEFSHIDNIKQDRDTMTRGAAYFVAASVFMFAIGYLLT